jgi:hypothetical protein
MERCATVTGVATLRRNRKAKVKASRLRRVEARHNSHAPVSGATRDNDTSICPEESRQAGLNSRVCTTDSMRRLHRRAPRTEAASPHLEL